MSALKNEINLIVENSFNEYVKQNNLVKILFTKEKLIDPVEMKGRLEAAKQLAPTIRKDLNDKLFSLKESEKEDIEYVFELIAEKQQDLVNNYYI